MRQRHELMGELRPSLLFLVHACAAGYKDVTIHTYPSPHPSSPTPFSFSNINSWLLNTAQHQTPMFGSEKLQPLGRYLLLSKLENDIMNKRGSDFQLPHLTNPVSPSLYHLSTGLACLGGDEFWGGAALQTPEPRTWWEEEAATCQWCQC